MSVFSEQTAVVKQVDYYINDCLFIIKHIEYRSRYNYEKLTYLCFNYNYLQYLIAILYYTESNLSLLLFVNYLRT